MSIDLLSLGFFFHYNNEFTKADEQLADQSRKAMFALRKKKHTRNATKY
jgi:hypothetical protein